VAADDPYLSWTPVPRASTYEVQLANDENFSTDVRTCTTALTSYTLFPGNDTDHLCHLHAGINWWRVRPLDQSSGASKVTGLYSAGQAFTWAQPIIDPVPVPAPAFTPVTGTAVGISAHRIDDDGGCGALLCGDMPATPVFDWDAQQYAKYYRVLVSEDADFTNVVANVVTNESRLALTSPLRESSAGGSYYWYVVP
jgi:hypothetical protein